MGEKLQMRQINLTYNCNLDCSYCYARDFSKKLPHEMSLDNLKIIFEWFNKQGIKDGISFIGGEPTTHSQFDSAVDMAQDFGVELWLYTNCLFDRDKLNIQAKALKYFIVNYNNPNSYTPAQGRLLNKNLEYLREHTANIVLRWNMSAKESGQHILNACKIYSINHVEFCPVFPSSLKTNQHIKKDELVEYKDKIINFVSLMADNGIKLLFGEPYPICFFTKSELKFVRKNTNFKGTCKSGEHYAILQDLRVIPCVALLREAPKLTEFKNEQAVINHYKKEIDKLKWDELLFEKCGECVYRLRRLCQGSCLCYKI